MSSKTLISGLLIEIFQPYLCACFSTQMYASWKRSTSFFSSKYRLPLAATMCKISQVGKSRVKNVLWAFSLLYRVALGCFSCSCLQPIKFDILILVTLSTFKWHALFHQKEQFEIFSLISSLAGRLFCFIGFYFSGRPMLYDSKRENWMKFFINIFIMKAEKYILLPVRGLSE